jgi:hypothetical protein
MSALRYLDPFPLLAVAGIAVATAMGATYLAPLLSETVASVLVLTLLVVLLVSAYVWMRAALTDD